MTVVSLISAFINLLTNTTVTIDVIESCFTGTCERTIGVRAISFWNAIMCEDIIASTFIDILALIVTICGFLVTNVTVAIIASVIVFAGREVWASCGTIVALVNIETSATTISETNTSTVVSVRTSAFKGEVNIGTSGKFVTCMFSEDTFVFLDAFDTVSFGTFSRN